MAQPICPAVETANAARSPLQEVLTAQPAVLIGLIAHIVGTPLQDIVRTTDRLLRDGYCTSFFIYRYGSFALYYEFSAPERKINGKNSAINVRRISALYYVYHSR